MFYMSIKKCLSLYKRCEYNVYIYEVIMYCESLEFKGNAMIFKTLK